MSSDKDGMGVLFQAALASGGVSASVVNVEERDLEGGPGADGAEQLSEKDDTGWLPKELKRLRKAVEAAIGATGGGSQSTSDPLTALNAPGGSGESVSKRMCLDRASAINWDTIANVHVRSKSAEQCRLKWLDLQRYPLSRGRWKADEDQRLIQAMQRQQALSKGMLDFVPSWKRVAAEVKTRSAQQCLHRWTKSLRPDIKRTRWSPEEDALLRATVIEVGYNWAAVRERIHGRTDMQCRERWMNVLSPAVSHSPWTADEDVVLWQAVEELGAGKWSQIAQRFQNRTDYQVRKRYSRLLQLRSGSGGTRPAHESQQADDGSAVASSASMGPPPVSSSMPPEILGPLPRKRLRGDGVSAVGLMDGVMPGYEADAPVLENALGVDPRVGALGRQ